MTNKQFYDLILTRVRRAGDINLRAVLLTELRQMLQSMERNPFQPWFLERVSSGLITVASVQTIPVPDDYLLLVENANVYIVNEEDEKLLLKRGYHEDLEEKFANEDPGEPRTYDIFADKFWFGPIPDVTYPVMCKYFAKTTVPPDSDDEVSNPWILNAEDYLVTSAALRLSRSYIKDKDLTKDLFSDMTDLRNTLHAYNEARQHVDMNYSVDR